MITKNSSIWLAIDVAVLSTGLTTFWLLWSSSRSQKRFRHPPGPKGLPIIGNLLDLPTEKQWVTYTEWGKKYGSFLEHRQTNAELIYSCFSGPITYAESFGLPVVVLNTYDVACELLDRRSTNYSDRPSLYMINIRYLRNI